MDIQKKKDKEYLLKREKKIPEITKKKSIRHLVDNFPKYANRNEIAYFLARNFLFEKIINTRGSIIELGVGEGSGLLSWAQISAIREPLGAWRHIYGFDTFSGFPSVHKKDKLKNKKKQWKTGEIKFETFEELKQCIDLLDRSPYPPHFPKVELIKGDFLKTGKKFIKDNPHLLVSLLFIDVDIYAPTREALKIFLPRMPKGAIIAFDELDNHKWPGETLAFLDSINCNKINLKTVEHMPRVSYAIL